MKSGKYPMDNEAIQARHQLDRILNTLDNIVWSIEPNTFNISYFNPAAERIYGRSIVDFYMNPRLWLEAIHPDDRDFVEKNLSEISQKGVLDIEYRIMRPGGEVRWIHHRIHTIFDDAVFDEQGAPTTLIGLGVCRT